MYMRGCVHDLDDRSQGRRLFCYDVAASAWTDVWPEEAAAAERGGDRKTDGVFVVALPLLRRRLLHVHPASVMIWINT